MQKLLVWPGVFAAAVLFSSAHGDEKPSPLDRLDSAKISEDDLPSRAVKELVAVVRGPTRSVAAVAFSPDMSLLAATAWDNTTRLWKLGGPVPREWVVLEGSPSGLAFAPDGKILATGSMGTTVILWDVAGDRPKKRRTLPGHENRPFSLAFSPTGKMLASACNDPVVRIWKLADEEIEAWAVLEDEKTDAFGVSSLTFSPDGKRLAAGSFTGKHALRLWDVSRGFMDEVEVPSVSARLVTFSPDNNTLACAGPEAAVFLWDIKLAKTIRRLDPAPPPRGGPGASVRALAFAPNGKILASAGPQREVMLWEIMSGTKTWEWQFPNEVKALAFAADGRHLAAGTGDGTIYILRPKSR